MRKAKTFKDAWWSRELESEKQQVVKLFQIRMKNPTADNINMHKSAKKVFMKNIRKAKRSTWIEFCESINSPKNLITKKKPCNLVHIPITPYINSTIDLTGIQHT